MFGLWVLEWGMEMDLLESVCFDGKGFKIWNETPKKMYFPYPSNMKGLDMNPISIQYYNQTNIQSDSHHQTKRYLTSVYNLPLIYTTSYTTKNILELSITI